MLGLLGLFSLLLQPRFLPVLEFLFPRNLSEHFFISFGMTSENRSERSPMNPTSQDITWPASSLWGRSSEAMSRQAWDLAPLIQKKTLWLWGQDQQMNQGVKQVIVKASFLAHFQARFFCWDKSPWYIGLSQCSPAVHVHCSVIGII